MKSAERPLRWGFMLLGIIAAGACLAWWLAAAADREMRADLLRQARLLAESVNLKHVEALNGSAADLEKPEYLRLKEQFSAVRSAYDHCRFIYLLGQRPYGDIFFILDSEPPDSVSHSPPGRPYAEISEEGRKVFENRAAVVIGPASDRWGARLSTFVPLINPQSGELIAVLVMDIDVRDWKRHINEQAIVPAGLFTMALLAIAVFGLMLHTGRFQNAGSLLSRRKHHTPILILGVGLVLSLSAAWFWHQKESRSRTVSFQNLAESKTAVVIDIMHGLRDEGLEGLARFFEGSDQVTASEFNHYTQHLVNNRSVRAWGWIPPVPAVEKETFEKSARADGLEDFEIWQRDSSGNRVSPSGRDIYYPLRYIEPLPGNQQSLGFDLGADPISRKVIEEVLDNNLTAATDPIPAAQESGNSKLMQVYRPVHDRSGAGNLRGMVVAFLRPSDVLAGLSADPLMAVELKLLRSDAAPESLAVSWNKNDSPARGLPAGRPIMAVGKVFWIAAYAGPDFLMLHPRRHGIHAALFGMLLTISIAVLVSLAQRRRHALRDLVRERTAALSESEERYRVLFDQSIDAKFLLEPPLWRFSSSNQAAHKLFGVENEDDFLTLDPWKVSPEKQPDGCLSEEKAPKMITEALRKGSCFFEWLHQSRDGKSIPCLVLLNRITTRDRTFLLATVRDITELKRKKETREKLRAQLMHAQKMESIGRLAGGVAHDFNNMLNVILGNTEMALDQIDRSHPIYAELDEIRKTVGRSANLVRQLLGFARKQPIAPEFLDLNRTVDETLKMLRTLIGADIELVWRPAADLLPVKMDRSQIEQILANLCINARDAIENVGAITIETKNVALSEDDCSRRSGAAAGEYVLLKVCDNGCGMTEETLQCLFEPFFTTKPVDKGTGLGLSMVYGVVQQNNGFIEVDSAPGSGTAFSVYIPGRRTKKTVSHPSIPAASPARGSETILIVEDEPAGLRMAQRMLEKAGYTVLTANRPGEALRLAETHAGRIDLLISDVIMPEMNGRELAGKISSLIPGVRCLFMSGYMADVIAAQGIFDAGASFIQKPFSREALYRKVRETLDWLRAVPPGASCRFFAGETTGEPRP